MSQKSASDQVEFIRLNGTAVRVTSWHELAPGHFRLVAVVRGSGDARALAEVLSAAQLELDVPGQLPLQVVAADLDRRETGTPPAIITRFAVELIAASQAPVTHPPLSLDERVTALEREVAELRKLVVTLANHR